MIKKTIEISQQAVHLAVQHRQLVIQPFDGDKQQARTIPCEDIGVVLIDHPAVTMTHRALTMLTDCGAAVVFCGPDHLPAGMMLPLSTHTQVVERMQIQINASQPARKNLWKMLVRAKVNRQADNLPEDSPAARTLRTLAGEVKSGDTTNVEGQAARIYWAAWLAGEDQPRLQSSVTAGQMADLKSFKRDQDGLDPANVLLNYGYTVLRAALGRAIVSAGLIPSLGIAHRHRANAFALADDLIEPFRPLVDACVRELLQAGQASQGLTPAVKAVLLSLLTHPVKYGQTQGPLMVALHRYLASFVQCLTDVKQRLMIPAWKNPAFRIPSHPVSE